MRKRIFNNGLCPECHSDHVVKAGFGSYKDERRQRYLCMDCRRITIKPLRQSELEEVSR